MTSQIALPPRFPWDVTCSKAVVKCRVSGMVADVELTQRFTVGGAAEGHHSRPAADNTKPMEVSFMWPKYSAVLKSSATVVHRLEATVDGRKICAKIRETDKAFDVYDDAIASGHAAVIVRSEGVESDWIKLSLGNIGFGSVCEITVGYSSLLFWSKSALSLSIPVAKGAIEAELQLECNELPAVPDVVRWAGEDCTSQFINNPACLVAVAHCPQQHTKLLFGFPPSVTNVTPTIATESFSHLGSYALSWSTMASNQQQSTVAPVEAVFLIDQSGSMSGDRIDFAREALLLFVASLPVGSKCQIIGFGSYHVPLFAAGSCDYNDETLQKLRDHVMNLDANLGGTYVTGALAFALQKPAINLPRVVIILTDGQVTQPETVIPLIRQHSGIGTMSRVHVVGVGSGVDTEFLSQVAAAGSGSAVFVREAQSIRSCVMSLASSSILGASFAPTIKPTIESGDDAWTAFPPQVAVFPGEMAFTYAMTTCTTTDIENALRLDGAGDGVQLVVPKFSAVARIVAWMRINMIQCDTKLALKLALTHSILTDQTAFVAVIDKTGQTTVGSMQSALVPPMIDLQHLGQPADLTTSCSSKKKKPATSTTPRASTKASTVMVDGVPCTVLSQSTSKTGKHGHQKTHVMVEDPLTGSRKEMILLATEFAAAQTQAQQQPAVNHRYVLLSVDAAGEIADVMKEDDGTVLQLPLCALLKRDKQKLALAEVGECQAFTLVLPDGHEEVVDIKLVNPPAAVAVTTPPVAASVSVAAEPSKTTSTTMNVLTKISILQQANGQWTATKQLAELIGVAVTTFDQTPSLSTSVTKDQWATALVIVFLETKLPSQQSEWLLMNNKAKSFLSQLADQLIIAAKHLISRH